jgi:hypothetical protein
MEIDPAYCDVIVRRWQEFTGKAAVLDGEDRVFDNITSSSNGGGLGRRDRL